MNRKIPIIAVPVGIVIILIVFFSNLGTEFDDVFIKKQHEVIWSGPVGVTKYQHRLGDNVFLVIRNLQPNEKDTLHIYTPKGVEYKTVFYDGAFKSNFNQYFYPDTNAFLNICTPEDLIGIWKIVFEEGSYDTLEFEMTNKWVDGAEASITVVC